jgi:hypothetical protein
VFIWCTIVDTVFCCPIDTKTIPIPHRVDPDLYHREIFLWDIRISHPTLWGCLYGGEPARVPKLARFAELISSCVSMRLLRRVGSSKQTTATGLTAINSIICYTKLKFALPRATFTDITHRIVQRDILRSKSVEKTYLQQYICVNI